MSKRRTRHPIHGTTQAPCAPTMRIRTRLRYSLADMVVLVALAEHFEALVGRDLAARCRAGSTHTKTTWATRKRRITSECSSRWAGWVTKSSNDAYSLAVRNQRRALTDKEKATLVIAKKLALPVHTKAERKSLIAAEAERAKAASRKPRRLDFGYRSSHEHAMKRRRLSQLDLEIAGLRCDIAAGAVHITRGGKNLLRNRLHLKDAVIGQDEWRARWHAKRWGFGANGEAGKHYGNETIRVSPDGVVEVDLPQVLASLANVTARGLTRYRFDAKVAFSYRQEDWRSQVEADRAVAYDVVFDPEGKVYLDASFTPAGSPAVQNLEDLLAMSELRVLALDLNHGFLAPAVLDRSGNPISRLAHIPFVTDDLPASQRDGHLRRAITEAMDLAQMYACKLVAVENLGFDEIRATGRERYGSRRWFRKVISGIPTAQFRNRLVAMASRLGIAVVGVPAAYSSMWGAEHWQEPLSTKRHKVSGHTAAAVVLGRRALGHPARRRAQASPGVTTPDRRIEAAGKLAGVESYHVQSANGTGPECKDRPSPSRRKGSGRRRATRPVRARGRPEAPEVVAGESRPAKTVRAGRVSLIGTQ